VAKKGRKIVEKPFCDGTMTRAGFFSWLRSFLRKKSLAWKPIKTARDASRVPYVGPNKLRKWSYRCSGCSGLFSSKEIEVDHIAEAGSLKSFEDIPGFIQRLFCDSSGLKVLCKEHCHHKKTHGVKEQEDE
jgi:hypothetical protein